MTAATKQCVDQNAVRWTTRARIDDAVRKVWLAYRDASQANLDMLTEQDMELWEIVTRHRAIQDRLNTTLPNSDVIGSSSDHPDKADGAHGSVADVELTETYPACPNCKERKVACACLINTCIRCGNPVGNITFTVCDECWH